MQTFKKVSPPLLFHPPADVFSLYLPSGTPSQDAHDLYLSSIRRYASFAPAFTFLGVYYASLSPPDTVRSSGCLQRAFELDPRQGEAARRLADNFADEKEWELVELIAKRTIEGEGGLEGGLESKGTNEREREAKGRFLVENIWAWKALGAVELVKSLLSVRAAVPLN